MKLGEFDEIQNPEALTNPEEQEIILKITTEEKEKENYEEIEFSKKFREEKSIKIKENPEKMGGKLFSGLIKLYERLKNIKLGEKLGHEGKMEILTYLFDTKEIILEARSLNVIFSEQMINRLTKVAKIIKNDENNVMEY